jgi:hypothetical protein
MTIAQFRSAPKRASRTLALWNCLSQPESKNWFVRVLSRIGEQAGDGFEMTHVSYVYNRVKKAEFRQTKRIVLNCEFETTVGTLEYCLRDRFLNDPVDGRQWICSCLGVLSRKRRTGFDEPGHKHMHSGRCRLPSA